MRSAGLVQRAGHVDGQATLVRAAFIAAHGSAPHGGGFRATDVRFFFRLFANWTEQDVTRAGLDLELTQVRRMLLALQTRRELEPLSDVEGKASRGRKFRLTPTGLLSLSEGLVADMGTEFSNVLFVLTFAASYRDSVSARVLGAGGATDTQAKRRLGLLLDPSRILRTALVAAERLVHDLESRLAADRRLGEKLGRHLADGRTSAEIVRELDDIGAYGLQRLRPLLPLLLSLPEDLRFAELKRGIALRRRFLFEPLLQRAHVELHQLRSLRTHLR